MPLSKKRNAERMKEYRRRLHVQPENDPLQSTRKPLPDESYGSVPTDSDRLHTPIVIVKVVKPPPVKPDLDADGNVIPEYW